MTVEALRRLATRLDVDEVTFVPLAAHGRLRLSGARLILEVNSELTEFETRFTLAHELAHRVIEGSRVDEARVTGRANRVATAGEESDLEALCDLVAGEVLLPEDWLLRRIDYETSTEAALDVAEELGYPIEFVLGRIFELRIWGGWYVVWDIGESSATPLHIPAALGNDFADDNVAYRGSPLHVFLQQARAKGPAPMSATVELRFGRSSEPYRLEAFAGSESNVVALARRRL